MQDEKFSKEINLCNLLRNYLINNNSNIIQLVSPGGQATLSITYNLFDGKKKTIFPDLIAVFNDNIIIGEIKPKYSINDEAKLLSLLDSVNASDKIRSLINRYLDFDIKDMPIRMTLIHGDDGVGVKKIDQLILGKNNYWIHRI